MIQDVQRLQMPPTTLHEWERVLARGLLRADGGNSDAIRSFEITPETLAMHCGLDEEHADAAEAAFRQALRADPHLHWCLQHGTFKVPGNDQPNCIAMLALSLLVDSLLDGVYEDKGQYRAKLSEWLGETRSFMDLRGIAAMWMELVTWLDGRVAAGAPFRRLVLPTIPRSWTHIGYTRYLSFPTKRDIRLLTKQIGRTPNAGIDPAALVTQLDPVVRSSVASHGLRAAFDDFRTALRSGAASVDHRFWRLVIRAREQAGHASPVPGSLVMELDEDGVRRFRVGGGTDARATPEFLGSAVGSPAVADSSNLGPSIRRGILFFRSSGLASWTATGEPSPGNGPFHLGIAQRHARLASGAIANFVASGTWLVTDQPIPAGTVTDVLRRIGITNAKQTVRRIGLVDGIHVGSAWLGQPRYLPYLDGASGEVEITPLDGGSAGRLTWANGDLRSAHPVDGEFSITDSAAHWARRASFVSLADIHADLDGASYSIPTQTEWKLVSAQRVDRAEAIEPTWDSAPCVAQDAIEALYACSRSGITEGEAIQIIGRAVGRRSWDMLRALQETSFFDARPRPRWRGRTFTLGRPRLSKVRFGAEAGLLVSGAMPARLEADFRRTVGLQGGIPFRRLARDCYAPPLLGAIGVAAESLSAALGWPLTDAPAQPDGTAATRLIETGVSGDGYQPSSFWDWSLGRFRVGAGTGSDTRVSLVRLVHPGGRDHDVYRVRGRAERSFHSRHAAILDAHSQAGRPLFQFTAEGLTRLAAEGALPLEIMAAMRVRTLSHPECGEDGWRYVASRQDAIWLSSLLPGLIDGMEKIGGSQALNAYRRGRGSRRPLWSDGGIAA
ncbi:hypothetical protein QE363_001767 [Sphingomonas sp. SORGH_AS870]|uniref:hypothetical protein n=1 Tax=Sphingomonas sp. SORGH_AS_0870 TaxID=3041801 RepID=UPI002864D16F|nr:hypothetical protein [Sphingomonas sp. SORGH_AS_0870]MDR6145974.1 hypothetical protein [Sphingomonas sp. SORGH_AS_0870]